MFNLTPEQVAEIINDPDLTSVDKINKLSRYCTIDPTTCTPDRVYNVHLKDRGMDTIGWRGSGHSSQWCVKNRTGAMEWAEDSELNVLGEVDRPDDTHTKKVCNPAEKTYRNVADMVVDGAGVGTIYRDRDDDTGTITSVDVDDRTFITVGNAGESTVFGPYTIIKWVAA